MEPDGIGPGLSTARSGKGRDREGEKSAEPISDVRKMCERQKQRNE